MGRQRRPTPRLLAKKLRAIRAHLEIGQAEMARRLGKVAGNPDGAMVSRFERGQREPNLLVIVAYAKAVGIPADPIIDDAWTMKDFLWTIKEKK